MVNLAPGQPETRVRSHTMRLKAPRGSRVETATADPQRHQGGTVRTAMLAMVVAAIMVVIMVEWLGVMATGHEWPGRNLTIFGVLRKVGTVGTNKISSPTLRRTTTGDVVM
mgnify:CR=1 FL=1